MDLLMWSRRRSPPTPPEQIGGTQHQPYVEVEFKGRGEAVSVKTCHVEGQLFLFPLGMLLLGCIDIQCQGRSWQFLSLNVPRVIALSDIA